MATLQATRPRSVAAGPSNNAASFLPPPPSSPTIVRTAEYIFLPSIPTHEPEDGLPPPLVLQNHLVNAVSRSLSQSADLSQTNVQLSPVSVASASTSQTDRKPTTVAHASDETEEVEELMDDDEQKSTSTILSNVEAGASLHRLQRTTMDAFSSILQEIISTSLVDGFSPDRELSDLLFGLRSCVRNMNGASAPNSPSLSSVRVDDNLASSSLSVTALRSDPDSTVYPSELSRFNQLLAKLSELGQGKVKPQDINLATALGAMYTSIDHLIVTAGLVDTFSPVETVPTQIPPQRRSSLRRHGSSASISTHKRRESVSTIRSTYSEELRDPFAVTQDRDVLEKLHRQLSVVSALARSGSEAELVTPSLTHTSDADVSSAHPADAAESKSETAGNYLNSTPSATEVDDPSLGPWSQLTQLLNITTELVSLKRSSTKASESLQSYSFPASHKESSPNLLSDTNHSEPGLDKVQKRSSLPLSTRSDRATTPSSIYAAADRVPLQRVASSTASAAGSLPPRYSIDGIHDLVEKGIEKPHSRPSSLPSYSEEVGLSLPSLYDSKSDTQMEFQNDAKVTRQSNTVKPSREDPTPTSTASSVYTSRSPQDLLDVQNAIDRLYNALPQLVNQRATMSPRKLRDAQLSDVLDRLAETNRMDDQRVLPRASKVASLPHLNLSKANATVKSDPSWPASASAASSPRLKTFSAAASLGRKFSISSLASSLRRASFADIKGKGREKDKEIESGKRAAVVQHREADHDQDDTLNDLINSIGKAQGMSFGDQRTDGNPLRTSSKAQDLIGEAPIYLPFGNKVEVDGNDDDRLFELLTTTSRSRLADQDAPLPRANRKSSQPMVDSLSQGCIPLTRVQLSSDTAFHRRQGTAAMSSNQPNSGSDRAVTVPDQPSRASDSQHCELVDVSGLQTRKGLEGGEHGGTDDPCSNGGVSSADASPILFFAESQPNLNNLSLFLWTEQKEGQPFPSEDMPLIYKLVHGPQPSSLSDENTVRYSNLLEVRYPNQPQPFVVPLPVLASAPQSGSVLLSQGHYSLKLSLYRFEQVSAALPSPSTSSGVKERSRSSSTMPLNLALDPGMPAAFPLSAQELTTQPPVSFVCSSCQATLIDASECRNYRPLPSQHWEELVDAWMCHADQELNASVARGRQGMEEDRFIPADKVWVGDQHLVFAGRTALDDNLEWDKKALLESSDINQTDVCCRHCGSHLGSLILTLNEDGTRRKSRLQPSEVSLELCSIKLQKLAILPRTSIKEAISSRPSILAALVSAQLLDVSRSQATHHFLIQDDSGNPFLLIWLFHPLFQFTSTSCPSPPRTAIKVLYKCFPTSSPLPGTLETITLPTRHANQLVEMVGCSNKLFPLLQRQMFGWNLGWIDRLVL